MLRPRLIALDLDGTLLDAEHEVTPRAQRAIEQCTRQGIAVVLCTGRPPRMTHGIATALKLEVSIVYNGASRYHLGTEDCIHHHELSPEEAERVIQRIRTAEPEARLGLETSAGWYLDTALYEAARERLAAGGLRPPTGVGDVESFLDNGAIKVFARHPERTPAELAAGLGDLPVYATWSGPGLLEVMHPEVNKRDALQRLIDERDIRREEVAAFGDNHNDVEMLAWAGHSVATANASPEVLAAADEVTAHHDEDGVAVVLERWID